MRYKNIKSIAQFKYFGAVTLFYVHLRLINTYLWFCGSLAQSITSWTILVFSNVAMPEKDSIRKAYYI